MSEEYIIDRIRANGRDYVIADTTARQEIEELKDMLITTYFAIYSADDNSLTFYGDIIVPQEGIIYNGKTATNVYTGVEDTGTDNPPWYSICSSIKIVETHRSFRHCRPKSCYGWFSTQQNATTMDLRYLDTAQVTNMDSMFCKCHGLTALDVSGFDTAQVTNMKSMFDNCDGLTALDVSGFDTAQVTNMESMFQNCDGLTTLDVSGFDTAQVTNMDSMFCNCDGLTALDVSGFDTAQVTNMSYLFFNCTGLTALDVSGFDTAQVTNMGRMFYYCTGLTTIYSDDDHFVTGNVTSSSNMFSYCNKLVGGNGTTIYTSTNMTAAMAHVDTADNPGYFTAAN